MKSGWLCGLSVVALGSASAVIYLAGLQLVRLLRRRERWSWLEQLGQCDDLDPAPAYSYSVSTRSHCGFVGGGQIGYNFQVGEFVYGFETDIQYANIGENVDWGPYGRLAIATGNSSGGYLGTVRARGGTQSTEPSCISTAVSPMPA